MKAIIRIKGLIGVPKVVKETLERLRLRKKYTCIVVKETKETLGMLKKIRNYVAYGDIDKKTLVELIEKRGKSIVGKKIDAEKLASEIEEGKKIKEIKPYFRLHPPRKGIKSKIHFPKGVLGDNKEKINDLIKRML